MRNHKINLALISPQNNAVSETFIKAHKLLPFNVKHYYGGYFPNKLENSKSLYDFSLIDKVKFKFIKHKDYTKQAIIKSFKNESIDCVLAEYGPVGVEIMPIAKLLNIPLITHFHGFDATNANVLWKYKAHYKLMFDYASYIIVVSKKMQGDLVNLGCSKNKIVLNPCGPSPSFFDLTPNFHITNFIAIARFVDVKGYLITLTAFRKLKDLKNDVSLTCIGDGPQLETCKQLVRILKLEDSVFFLGALSPLEVQKEINKSYAFVQHSVTLSDGLNEGTPVSLMESMASGLPAICSDSGGIKDVVSHNETGFLVDEFDVESMAHRMLDLIENKEMAKRMGNAGKQRIKKYFSQENHLKIIEDLVINSVL